MDLQLIERLEWFLGHPPVRGSQVVHGIAVASVKGPVRKENQDRAVAAFLTAPRDQSCFISLICDGMGGMAEGGAAANVAVGAFLSYMATTSHYAFPNVLTSAVIAANAEVYTRFRGNGGATLSALIIRQSGDIWIAHVGDSRIYQFDNENELRLLTRDDTIQGMVQGQNDEAELDNRLLQFIGIGRDLEPHIWKLPPNSSGRYLLTSDGAHGLGKRSIEGMLRNSLSPSEWARRIAFVADATSVEDNASAIAVWVSELRAPRTFHSGTTLLVWNSEDTLELWLAQSLPREISDRPSKPPPKRKNSNKKKSENTQAKKLLEKQPDKPQLKISFGDINEGEG